MDKESVTVVSAGAFGAAMGIVADRNGYNVTLHVTRDETLEDIKSTREHPRLHGVEIPRSVTVTTDLQKALEGRSVILLAAPSHRAAYYGEQVARYADWEQQQFLSLTKGFYVGDSQEVTVFTDMMRQNSPDIYIAAESGPNFAKVVAEGEQRVQTIVASRDTSGRFFKDILANENFIVELSEDEVGTQAAGAAKNICAFGIGMCEGSGVDAAILAKLISYSPTEMERLIVAMGGQKETATGIAGKDDLELTCTSGSRNYRAGVRIGNGEIAPADLLRNALAGEETAEGVLAAKGSFLLQQQYNIELPIMSAVSDVMYHGISVNQAVKRIRALVQLV